MTADDPRQRLVSRIRELARARGMTIVQLAEAASYTDRYLTSVLSGRTVPSAKVVATLDRILSADGELVALRDQAAQQQLARRHGLAIPEKSPTGSQPAPARRTLDVASHQEVSPTDRRDALRLLGLGPVAVELSRRIARADPDPLTLDQYDADLHRLAAAYRDLPHAEVESVVGARWQSIETLLDGRVSAKVRGRLTLLAGNFAFYIGLVSFDLGDDEQARAFLHLANRHATEASDLLPPTSRSEVQLLAGSVAAIRSTVAYFNGAYPRAADLAGAALPSAHPFTRPILAGCQARAASLAGRPDEAHAALADMQEHVWQSPGILPGPNPGGPAFANGFMAVTLAHLGDGERAETHARVGLNVENPGHYVQVAGTLHTLARTYLRRPSPEPEAAADAATRALAVLDGRPTRGVIQQTGQTWQEMHARWPALPAVRDLGELVSASRRALPASPQT